MTRVRTRLTTDRSSYGVPVFVRGRQPVDYAAGLRALRAERGWSVAELATIAGVSPRTVEGWEQGRMPAVRALLALQTHLGRRP